jgi:long-subunit acyl-CoA synthetase (AMP-forming)
MPSNPAALHPRTVMQVLDEAAHLWPNLPALKVKRGGRWVETTWRGYREAVRMAARAFMTLGLAPGKGVVILGYNSPEWFFADVAAIFAGGVPAGIYTTSSAEQCRYIADHCEAAVAVVENRAQLEKLLAVRGDLPHLRAIVVVDGDGADPARGLHAWADLARLAEATPEAALEARIAAQKAEDLATLIYTSGTTGHPKAVMISHDNITWTAQTALQLLDLRPGESVLSYLPLSHVAEQLVSIHGPMVAGVTTWFAEGLEQLGENLREVRPHAFLGVPRVWEKMQAKIMAIGASQPPLRKKIASLAKRIGLAAGYADQRGGRRPLLYPLAQRLIFDRIRERLGLDRCRLQATSAAPISKDTLDFFLSLGLPLYEIYGMSECTGPATVSLPGAYQTGSTGTTMPGTELRIAPDGEICMRGRHVFMGYLKNPEATAEALDAEGWLHSGDIGALDSQGFLRITDRKKDLLITAGGENIAPQLLEGMLKDIPVVSQAVVIGDRRKYLAALLTLDPERLPVDAAAAGSPARTPAEAATCPRFLAFLEAEVARLNGRLAQVQTIKRFRVLPHELTIEGGELTPTMKLKRKVINARHAATIAELYPEG